MTDRLYFENSKGGYTPVSEDDPLPVTGGGGGGGNVNLTKVGGASFALGQETMVGSLPVVLASDQSNVNVALSGTATVTGTVAATQSGAWTVSLTDYSNGEYEAVAASASKQPLGSKGAAGDFLTSLTVYPATVDAGTVILYDGSTAIATFTGGTAGLTSLAPFVLAGGIKSTGILSVTTGTGVSALATGNFT